MSFYVYELRDPRSDDVFYVGKGKGNRIHAHEKEAERGVQSPKCNVIRDIWASGLQVEKNVIARFHDEAEAYAAEKAIIDDIGLQNLTNIAPGGIWHPRERVGKRAPWSLASLMQLAPALARAAKEYAKHGNLYALDHDISGLFVRLVRSLMKDCGEQAVRDALTSYGVDPLISWPKA
jgi:hypothetical protein